MAKRKKRVLREIVEGSGKFGIVEVEVEGPKFPPSTAMRDAFIAAGAVPKGTRGRLSIKARGR